MAVIAPMRPRRLGLLESDGLGSAPKLSKYLAIMTSKRSPSSCRGRIGGAQAPSPVCPDHLGSGVAASGLGRPSSETQRA